MKKRIFVNIFVNNILHHNRCALDIEESSNGNTEAAQLAVDIAHENNFPVECMRFEIVNNTPQRTWADERYESYITR